MQLRVFHDPLAAGDWNMAVDEALLEDVATGGEPALRFYGWSPATLSLGYFQPHEDRQLHAASLNCPCVRRQSGGGAILHDRELTYSLIVPAATFPRRTEDLYRLVHESLIAALAEFGVAAEFCGYALRESSVSLAACQPVNVTRARADEPPVEHSCPFLCFQRRSEFDLLVDTAKIAGSAQRRRRGGLLQHGSVLLAASTFAPELPGISDAAAKAVEARELADAWCASLAGRMQYHIHAATYSDSIRHAAEMLRRRKYASDAWNLRR